MKKLLLSLLLLGLFFGCGAKKFYTLGDTFNVHSTISNTQTIDVVKVSVPKYLKEHKIVRQITPYQIELIDKAQWLIPMEQKLTAMLIDYLQQSLNNPNVYLYPWQSSRGADKRVELKIQKFIASKQKVMLKANYKIVDLKNSKNQIYNFSTTLNSGSSIESMMQAMEEAYLALLEDIKTTLINNK